MRRKHYRFTEKKHSRRGMLACFLAAASIFALVYAEWQSYLMAGEGSVYLGSFGFLAMVVSLIAMIQAIASLKEEDTFRGIPIISVCLSILALGAWGSIYGLGFCL